MHKISHYINKWTASGTVNDMELYLNSYLMQVLLFPYGNVMCMFTEYSPLKMKMALNCTAFGAPLFSASTKILPLNIVCPVLNLPMVVINMHTSERRVKYK